MVVDDGGFSDTPTGLVPSSPLSSVSEVGPATETVCPVEDAIKESVAQTIEDVPTISSAVISKLTMVPSGPVASTS